MIFFIIIERGAPGPKIGNHAPKKALCKINLVGIYVERTAKEIIKELVKKHLFSPVITEYPEPLN